MTTKAAKKTVKKKATVSNKKPTVAANKVTLTLKQAQTIQNTLTKAGKASKVLENKINSLTV